MLLGFLTLDLPLGEMDQESEWCHLKNMSQRDLSGIFKGISSFLDLESVMYFIIEY